MTYRQEKLISRATGRETIVQINPRFHGSIPQYMIWKLDEPCAHWEWSLFKVTPFGVELCHTNLLQAIDALWHHHDAGNVRMVVDLEQDATASVKFYREEMHRADEFAPPIPRSTEIARYVIERHDYQGSTD